MFTRRQLKVPNPPIESVGEDWRTEIRRLERNSYEQWRELQRFLRGLNDKGAIGLAAPNWTPVLTFGTPGDVATVPSTAVGDATVHGRLIFGSFRWVGTVTHTTAAGNLRITGFPYTPSSDSGFVWAGGLAWSGITKAGYTDIAVDVSAGSSVIEFTASGSGVAASKVAFGDVPTGGTVGLRGTFVARF